MTCPGCDREGVALVGGYCGMCSSEISGAVSDALEDVDAIDDHEIVDVSDWDDGYLHVRVDQEVSES